MAKLPTWSRISLKPILRCAIVPTNSSSMRGSGLASNLSGSASMPLVKDGKIVADTFIHVADDAVLPEGAAVLVSAARFLEDPEGLLAKAQKLGVTWPNNRDL